MKSLYNRLLIALQAHLAANVPEIKYVELDFSQLEIYDTRPAVAFPCALIRFTGAYEPRQMKTQINNFTMQVRLGFDVYGNTSSLVPEAARTAALAYFEVEQKLYLSLQEFTAAGLLLNGGLTRVADIDQISADGLRKRVVTFRGSFADSTLAV